MLLEPNKRVPAFLQGGGEMGTLIRSYDWESTPLGPLESWPASLRTTLGLLLHSAFPMFLYWGPDLICFYNDAFRPSLGTDGKHPAIGKRGREVWAEAWDTVGPQVEQVVLTGEPIRFEDRLIPIYRNGRLEDVYWTYGSSPVYDDNGQVGGVLITCIETTEHVAARRQLVASQQRFQDMVMQAPVAIAVFRGEDLIVELANDAYLPLIGKSRDELIGKPLFEVIPEAEETLRPLTRELFDTGMAFAMDEFELELNRFGEREICYFSSVWEPLREADGRINGFMAVAHEVTTQVLARKEVEASEQYARHLTDTIPAIIWTTEPDGYCSYLSKQWYVYTGQTPAEAEGFGWLDATHPDDKEEAGRRFLEANGQQAPFSALYRLRRHDGTYRWAIDQASPRFGPDGSYQGMIGTVIDVHDQKIAEEALRQNEARLRSIIATAPAAMGLFVGRDLVVELPNQAFIDIVGKGPDIEGKPLREVMPELLTENQPFLQILDDVYTSGRMFQSFGSQVKIVQNGMMTDNYYNITYTPLRDADGQVFAILDIAIDVTEQIKARRQAEESDQRFQNLIRQATVGIIVLIGADMVVEVVNDAYGRLIDRTREELLGKPLFDVIPETESYFRPILDGVRTTGEPLYLYEIPYSVQIETGTKAGFLDLVYQPYKEIDGTVTGITVLCQDVTAQVKARQKVEESEQNLRSLVESAPFPIGVYVGREMRIQLANQSILDVWSKGNDVIGKLYSDILPELANQEIFSQLDGVYTTGVPFHAKNQRVDIVVDGKLQPFYFNYSFTPLYDAEGNVYGVMNTAAEITDLVLAKQQVEEAETTLRGAIELAELATWSMNVETGRFTYSQRFMDWLGFSEATKSMDEAYNPLPSEYRQSVADAIAAVVQPGSSGLYENEHPIINRLTGQVRIIHAQAQVFYDADGRAATLSGTAQDVTEQRRLQQELERQVQERTEELAVANEELVVTNEDLIESNTLLLRSNENLQRFAYVASHDLQEPLRKIHQFSDLLINRYADQLGEGKGYLERMQSAASRMSTLIKDLLTFSRISTQREADTWVKLRDVVETAVSDLELSIQETGAQIQIDPLPIVEGDASQLGQLFQNLLTNALKFRRANVKPVIHIRADRVAANALPASVKPTRSAKLYHRIDVADNGIGFDEKYVDRIFQVFQRLHGKSQFAGTGIGLAICEKVAANHGGAITATSRPNQGATFSVYLPV